MSKVRVNLFFECVDSKSFKIDTLQRLSEYQMNIVSIINIKQKSH